MMAIIHDKETGKTYNQNLQTGETKEVPRNFFPGKRLTGEGTIRFSRPIISRGAPPPVGAKMSGHVMVNEVFVPSKSTLETE